jgi:hypothetical protein
MWALIYQVVKLCKSQNMHHRQKKHYFLNLGRPTIQNWSIRNDTIRNVHVYVCTEMICKFVHVYVAQKKKHFLNLG